MSMNPPPDTSHPVAAPVKNEGVEGGHAPHGAPGWIGRMERMMYDPLQRPLLIGLGPLPILCFIWIVYAVTYTHPIPLPDYLARQVAARPQSATVVVSIIATVLSSQTTFFFSLAVRYVLAIRLVTKHTSLSTLTSVTRIARGALWLQDPRASWTWITLLAFLAVSFQTSALTALFTVQRIPITYSMNGRDLNMADPGLLRASNTTLPTAYDEASSFFLQSAMVDAIQFRRNLPTTYNFNGYTYITTTGGIHPATYVSIRNQQFVNAISNASVPPNLNDLSTSKHTQLPFGKSMDLIQQGFTADVSCRLRDPQDNATYNPSIAVQSMGTGGLFAVQFTASCPDNTNSISAPVVYNTTDVNSGSVLGVSCPIPGTNNIEIILGTTGVYQNFHFTACTVSPKTTLVRVNYTTSPQNTDVPMTINVSSPINTADVPVWGRMATDMLLYNINFAQSLQGNTLGNAWFLTGANQAGIPYAEAMNTFIRASFEFTATAVRQILTLPGSPVTQADPGSSFFTPINGSFTATTYGWHQDHTISPLLLLPTTVTILATYGLLIYGFVLARKYKDVFVHGDAHFDPTDIVHVTAAYTPEIRQEDFRYFSQESAGYMRKTALKLESRGGVRAFNVSSNERAAAGQAPPGGQGAMPFEEKPDSEDLK